MDEFIRYSEELLSNYETYDRNQERIFLDEATEFLTSDYSNLLLRMDSSFDAAETKEVVLNLCNIAMRPSVFEHRYEAFHLLHKVHTEDFYAAALDNDYPDIQAQIAPVYRQVAPSIITHMRETWLSGNSPPSDGDLLASIILTHHALQAQAAPGAKYDGPV